MFDRQVSLPVTESLRAANTDPAHSTCGWTLLVAFSVLWHDAQLAKADIA